MRGKALHHSLWLRGSHALPGKRLSSFCFSRAPRLVLALPPLQAGGIQASKSTSAFRKMKSPLWTSWPAHCRQNQPRKRAAVLNMLSSWASLRIRGKCWPFFPGENTHTRVCTRCRYFYTLQSICGLEIQWAFSLEMLGGYSHDKCSSFFFFF